MCEGKSVDKRSIPWIWMEAYLRQERFQAEEVERVFHELPLHLARRRLHQR